MKGLHNIYTLIAPNQVQLQRKPYFATWRRTTSSKRNTFTAIQANVLRRPLVFRDRRWLPRISILVWSIVVGTAGAETAPPAIETKSGQYLISYETKPSPIPMNEFFELFVEIKGRHGTALAPNLALEVDAGMPHHNHGMNIAPKIEALGDGRFHVHGLLFHMPGRWLLSFTVKRGLMRDGAEQELRVQ